MGGRVSVPWDVESREVEHRDVCVGERGLILRVMERMVDGRRRRAESGTDWRSAKRDV